MVPTLVVCLIGLLLLRALFVDDAVGAAIVIGLFWLVALVLLIKLIASLASRPRNREHAFLLLALLAFVVSAILGKETVGPVTFILFLGSMFGLVAVWIGRWRDSRG